MSLQAVPPLLNGGARGTWLSANPGATRHLQVSSAGAVSTSAFDGSFGTLTGTPTTLSGYGITDGITSAAVAAGYQPLDSDLTSIASLTTTAFGRGLLTETDAASTRTTLSAFATSGGTMTGALSFSGTSHAGLRLNNLTSAQVSALGSPAAGMVAWDTDLTRMRVHNGTSWTNGFVRIDGDTMTGSLLATSFEARNATTATSVLVNNTWTSSTNRETGYMRWASNILSIGTEKGSGGGTARALQFETDGVNRLSIAATGAITATANIITSGIIRSTQTNGFSIGGDTGFPRIQYVTATYNRFSFLDASNSSTAIYADAISVGGILASVPPPTSGMQTSGAFLQWLARTDDSNYERSYFRWTSNILRIGTEKLGTGTARALQIETDGTSRINIAATGAITATSSLTWVPAASVTLGTNGQLAIEMTSNTAGNIVYRGSDGTTRRFAFTVA